MKHNTSVDYKKLQDIMVNMMDLKVGDVVVVTRTAIYGELGYPCSWNKEEMTALVGKEQRVIRISESGILIGAYTYPIYVLKKIRDGLPSFKISDTYAAEIQEDGSVKVGCQHIPYKTLQEIYDAASLELKGND